ncbi:pyridoxal phosphate-dependent aminotransferase [Defluviimonas sp. WL0002]|uniref:cysteine-S-conjugate beta-lyase n=1 Tax=Albidovulum marisflavi TaxID=2984159 RepID=A0ABT2Z9V5_9RHOB|nr:MalY/PatB family protein [Defluviimonas sp. WL0002]MCV2867897.1 pyridoxal phosphate-dependent aminotransferase [Defluviimonas sp. WL0002]
MSFDDIIDYRGTHSSKWDTMEKSMGVSAEDGLAMWVADMDFRPPEGMLRTVIDTAERGLFTYFGDTREYDGAIAWWMQTRHGWQVDPAAILTTHGIVNAVSMALETFTRPGDGVILMTPVYHAFGRVIRANDRKLVECPLVLRDGVYAMDFETWDGMMTGEERMLILCSPHNPGGRVWTRAELRAVADFARRHDLILVSDEIHHDLVYPGHKHIPMTVAAPEVADRLLMMTATSKTFNVAGMHCGNVIIPDPKLRAAYQKRLAQLAISPNSMSMRMTPALYSPEGAQWVDALCAYLDANHRLFVEGINAIPGLKAQPMQGTYLAWVDFADTGMTHAEYSARVAKDAKIAASPGAVFGRGGESFLRFNIGTQRARIEDALSRMHHAFRDLQ